MSARLFRRCAVPEVLRGISQRRLAQFLSANPVKEYLQSRGLPIPTSPAVPIDCDLLSAILINPDTKMPPALVNDVHLLDEMSTEAMMLDLLASAPDGMVELDGDTTPADVALQLLLKDRKFLERKCAEQVLHRFRAFRICQGVGTRQAIPEVDDSTHKRITFALGAWFSAHGRGEGQPQISMFPRAEEGQLWMLVQRGGSKRLQSTFDNGESSSLLFRPMAFDLVVYHREQDILVIHTDTDTKGERELYRTTIGQYLFGDADYFASEGNLTLAPLMERGRAALNCDGIEGVESIRLVEWEIYTGGGSAMFVRLKADDVFNGLENSRMGHPWGESTKAVFRVKFKDSKKPRSVALYPTSRDRYQRDDDRAAMEPFFVRNGFILRTKEPIDETACVTVDGT